MLSLFAMLSAMLVLFAAQNKTMNLVLWVAIIVVLGLLIMRRRARKQKTSRL